MDFQCFRDQNLSLGTIVWSVIFDLQSTLTPRMIFMMQFCVCDDKQGNCVCFGVIYKVEMQYLDVFVVEVSSWNTITHSIYIKTNNCISNIRTSHYLNWLSVQTFQLVHGQLQSRIKILLPIWFMQLYLQPN